MADQIRDRAPGPQRGRNAQLLRAVRAQQLLDTVCLLVREKAARTQRSARALVWESLQATLGISAPPAADRFAGDAEKVGHLSLRESPLTAMQGTQAQGFQDLIGQFASIRQ